MKRILLAIVLLGATGAGTLWWLGYTVSLDGTPKLVPPAAQTAQGTAQGTAAARAPGGRGRRGADPDLPVPVLAARAELRDVPIWLDALGTVQAYNQVQVRAVVEGPLLEVLFREGQDVKRGDVLARIDPRPYQASLDSATAKKQQDEANLANARVDSQRYARLAATAFSSAQQADTSRAQVAQLEAQVRGDQAQIDTARTQLSYATITAPFDGRVGIRQLDAGNIVRPGDTTPITVLTQLKPVSVVFTLPQQSLPAVAAAMQGGMPDVQAVPPGGSQRVLDRGQLAVLDNQVDPATGTIKLKATFPNEDLRLWPGGFVNIRLLVETRQGVTTVPTAAVQRGPRGTYVFVINPDMGVRRVQVATSYEDDQLAIVGTGLRPGDQVVIDGAQRLNDTSTVAIAGPDGSAPEAAPKERGAPGTAQRGQRRNAS